MTHDTFHVSFSVETLCRQYKERDDNVAKRRSPNSTR